MAEPHQKRRVRLEHVEAGLVEGLAKLGLAHVAMVAVAEPLEDCGRYEPAEGPDGGPEPLRATHLPKRLEDARRAVVGEEDRVPARLERTTARRQERRRIRVPVERMHAHEHVEAARAGQLV